MTNINQRRALLKVSLGSFAFASQLKAQEFSDLPAPLFFEAKANAANEAYWSKIADQYQVSSDFINLENGFYGIMSKPVLANYHQQIDRLNRQSSYYLREYFPQESELIRRKIANFAGVSPDEIALTRGATEALQLLLSNYNQLKPNDTVITADLDYDSALSDADYLKTLRGVNVVRLSLPEPASYQALIDVYAQAFEAYPRTKLVLLTHLNNKTGLVLPVAEIAQLAKAKGIDVLVDAAHSFGHLNFKITDLHCDYAVFNLHKWMGAPLGVGFLYIRKEKLVSINPQLTNLTLENATIQSRVHTGTTNTANVLTVPAALDFHLRIGANNKAARLAYLRDYWVKRVQHLPTISILTPDDPRLYGAITSFRLKGKNTKEDNLILQKKLSQDYGIFTVVRGGMKSGYAIRVTPSLFTRIHELDRLVQALTELAS